MTEPRVPATVLADAAMLQCMSHPLRMRMLGLLRVHGPSTATKLAERCGESSGLTSYHLRLLADAGLIVEAGAADLTGIVRTGGRERWWRAAYRFTQSDTPEPGDETGVAATADFLRTAVATNSRDSQSWLSVAGEWPREWQDASAFSDLMLRLTASEAGQLEDELWDVISRYRKHDPAAGPTADTPEDAVMVRLAYQLFPYADQEPPAASPQRGDAGGDLSE